MPISPISFLLPPMFFSFSPIKNSALENARSIIGYKVTLFDAVQCCKKKRTRAKWLKIAEDATIIYGSAKIRRKQPIQSIPRQIDYVASK